MSENRYNGILALDKPPGLSSHDAVQRVRKIIGQKSVGHTGTLDPAARGLLLLCIGNTTKLAGYITAGNKSYEALIRLGRNSKTYDAEGLDANSERMPVPELSMDDLNQLLSEFVGSIQQQVPAFSAIRVAGQRLYKLARKGSQVTPPVRQVEIHRIQLDAYDEPDLRIRVDCGKGTYMRSLAHDIGQRLGCGAYLADLKRTHVGQVDMSSALSFADVERMHAQRSLVDEFLPIDKVLDFNSVTISDDFKASLLNGRSPTGGDISSVRGGFLSGERILLQDSQGAVLAVGRTIVDSATLGTKSLEPIIEFDRVLV